MCLFRARKKYEYFHNCAKLETANELASGVPRTLHHICIKIKKSYSNKLKQTNKFNNFHTFGIGQETSPPREQSTNRTNKTLKDPQIINVNYRKPYPSSKYHTTASKYHTTLFKVPHHHLQSTTLPSSKYHYIFKIPDHTAPKLLPTLHVSKQGKP